MWYSLRMPYIFCSHSRVYQIGKYLYSHHQFGISGIDDHQSSINMVDSDSCSTSSPCGSLRFSGTNPPPKDHEHNLPILAPSKRLPKYSTRTCLQLSIHDSFTIQVIIHLRIRDLPWWNQDLVSHHTQLLQLIQNHILPAIQDACQIRVNSIISNKNDGTTMNNSIYGSGSEAASSHTNSIKIINTAMSTKDTKMNANTNSKKRSKVTKTVAAATATNTSSKGRKNQKQKLMNTSQGRNSTWPMQGDGNIATHTSTTTTHTIAGTTSDDNKQTQRKYIGDYRILMGDTIQITYKLQTIPDLFHTCTLIYHNQEEEEEDIEDGVDHDNKDERHTETKMNHDHDDYTKRKSHRTSRINKTNHKHKSTMTHFQHLRTHSQRIILWCFPLNIHDPTKPIPYQDGGFPPRQEMIPIASLFRLTTTSSSSNSIST